MSPQPLRIAFLGFRHGHILSLYKSAREHAGVQVVAACEERPELLAEIGAEVALTHRRIADVLERVECDAVAVGDVYGRRGRIVIDALRAGKHVISDKPICTRLAELEQIEQLCREKGLRLGCQLDLRLNRALVAMRRLIQQGEIGTVMTATFTAQHPLLLRQRPRWYFDPGAQGGTLNDIGIHGADAIPWLTGRQFRRVVAARAWNARLPQYPHFQDAAQLMAELDNGGGVLADVSYLAPDGCGYSVSQYWRITCHGDKGVLEARVSDSKLLLARSADAAQHEVELSDPPPASCLDAFLNEVAGRPLPGDLTTDALLGASRTSLTWQQAADAANAAAIAK